MIRALFVDDEPAVLEGLENRLRKLRSRWKVTFAASAEVALQKLAAEPFDVVVSDMRMPGMNGAQLLERVRANYPGIVRIVLTGQTGADLLLTSLPVAHQILSKPCDAQLLDAAVERARVLHAVLDNTQVRQALTGVTQLPALPQLYMDLTRKLEDPDARLGDVAAIVEQDASLTARILQLANSAFIGIGRTVTSAQDAVKYLGVNTLRSVVLSIELFQSLEGSRVPDGFSMSEVHAHSLRCARIALRVLSDENARRVAFSAAILHDLGSVVLATSLPEFYPPALERARSEGLPLHVAEYAVHGFGHGEVAAYLLALWGLPAPIVEAVAHHHRPSRSQEQAFGAVGALHVADRLAHDLQLVAAGTTFDGVHARTADFAYLDRVEMRGQVDVWRALIAKDPAAA